MASRFGLRALLLGLLGGIGAVAPATAWDANKASSNLMVPALSDAELALRKITRVGMGELQLPTGQVVVADPLVTPERAPLERRIAPGSYPVMLYQAHGRNALAVLRIAPGEAVRWEIATIAGQDAATLKDGDIFGYPVDAGTGSFMDKSAYPLMLEREKREIAKGATDFNYYDHVLADEYEDFVMHRPLPDSPVNVAVFSSGWGDGFYASFWGLDAAGRPLILLTDFQVLENGDARTAYERDNAAAIAAIPQAEQSAVRDAYAAIQRDDLDALAALLKRGAVRPDSYVEETGFTLTLETIRHLKPKALELLIRHGASRDIPAGMLEPELRTYPDYARRMMNSIGPGGGIRDQLGEVAGRWDAGQIPTDSR